MNWIKVKDRLPEMEIVVLVYCPLWGMYIAHYEKIDPDYNAGHWIDFYGNKGILPPTHWMPLPEPPITETPGD